MTSLQLMQLKVKSTLDHSIYSYDLLKKSYGLEHNRLNSNGSWCRIS